LRRSRVGPIAWARVHQEQLELRTQGGRPRVDTRLDVVHGSCARGGGGGGTRLVEQPLDRGQALLDLVPERHVTGQQIATLVVRRRLGRETDRVQVVDVGQCGAQLLGAGVPQVAQARHRQAGHEGGGQGGEGDRRGDPQPDGYIGGAAPATGGQVVVHDGSPGAGEGVRVPAGIGASETIVQSLRTTKWRNSCVSWKGAENGR
jgi:hypothetical protein